VFSMRRAGTAPAPRLPVTGAPTADFAQRDLCIEDFIERYAEWREDCHALASAYREWARSKGSARRPACATYRAALDREEKAASLFRLAAASLEGSGWSIASSQRPCRSI